MQKLILAGERCHTMRASVERHEGPGWKRGQGARGAQAAGLLFTDFQKNVETVH